LCRFYSTPIISAFLLPLSPLPFLFSVVHCKNEQHIFETLKPSTKARVRFNSRPSKFREPQARYLPPGPPLLHLKTSIKSSLISNRSIKPRAFVHFWRFRAVELRNTSRIARQIQSRSTSSSLPRLKYWSRARSRCLLRQLNTTSRLLPYRLPVNAFLKVKIHGVPLVGRKRSGDIVSDIFGPSFPDSQSSQSQNLLAFVSADVRGLNHRTTTYFNGIRNALRTSFMVARRPCLSISRCATVEKRYTALDA
jgi:hypothetical protein